MDQVMHAAKRGASLGAVTTALLRLLGRFCSAALKAAVLDALALHRPALRPNGAAS